MFCYRYQDCAIKSNCDDVLIMCFDINVCGLGVHDCVIKTGKHWI